MTEDQLKYLETVKPTHLLHYPKGALIAVMVLRSLEKENGGKKGAISYSMLMEQTGAPMATIRRWVREAKHASLMEPHGALNGGTKAGGEGGERNEGLYKLTAKGREVAG